MLQEICTVLADGFDIITADRRCALGPRAECAGFRWFCPRALRQREECNDEATQESKAALYCLLGCGAALVMTGEKPEVTQQKSTANASPHSIPTCLA